MTATTRAGRTSNTGLPRSRPRWPFLRFLRVPNRERTPGCIKIHQCNARRERGTAAEELFLCAGVVELLSFLPSGRYRDVMQLGAYNCKYGVALKTDKFGSCRFWGIKKAIVQAASPESAGKRRWAPRPLARLESHSVPELRVPVAPPAALPSHLLPLRTCCAMPTSDRLTRLVLC